MNAYKYASNLSQKDSSSISNWTSQLKIRPIAKSTACYNSPLPAKKRVSPSSSSYATPSYEDFYKYHF